ncbi:hypothetical protein C8J57DRAFT_1538213 [Mycena rebaudengoi]|nr:hypothetical protein C8J57DRAFT_1538213 [Mycena rebaudengoi]
MSSVQPRPRLYRYTPLPHRLPTFHSDSASLPEVEVANIPTSGIGLTFLHRNFHLQFLRLRPSISTQALIVPFPGPFRPSPTSQIDPGQLCNGVPKSAATTGL